jgi:hypothetical protein
MTTFRMTIISATLIAACAVGVSAQKHTTAKKTTAKKSATPVKIIPPLDVRAGREKVDVQLSNVNGFVTKLTTIAQGLEIADKDAQAGNLKPETKAKIDAKKKEIVEAINNISIGLRNLESEFRTKAALSKYLPSLQGITELASQAEDSAVAGQFVAAKDPLRTIAGKLTDTLGVMPL